MTKRGETCAVSLEMTVARRVRHLREVADMKGFFKNIFFLFLAIACFNAASCKNAAESGGGASVKICTVTFDLQKDGKKFSQKVVAGEKLVEPKSPESAGCDFLGWHTEESCENRFDFNTKISNDIVLFAKWQTAEDKITIVFHKNDGSDTKTTLTMEKNEPIILAALFSQNRKFVAGWAESATGSQVHTAGAEIKDGFSENKDFYAVWQFKKYSIVFDENGSFGASFPTEYETANEAQSLDATTKLGTGMLLTGWEISGAEGGTPIVEDGKLKIPEGVYGNLTVKALWENTTLRFTAKSNAVTLYVKSLGDGAARAEFYYSKDMKTWDNAFVDGSHDKYFVINDGETIYLVGNNDTLSDNGKNYINFCSSVLDGDLEVSGSVMSLLDKDVVPYGAWSFYKMFAGCKSLVSAPELPATTLGLGCYEEMFSGCTRLTVAPKLPATTLNSSCYKKMFAGCTALTVAPELPATTLNALWVRCYEEMFSGCSNLKNVQVEFSSWTDDATYNWLNGVASTGTFICPEGLDEQRDVSHIPEGWTVQNE